MSVRAVLFDAGNTLLFLDYGRLAAGVTPVDVPRGEAESVRSLASACRAGGPRVAQPNDGARPGHNLRGGAQGRRDVAQVVDLRLGVLKRASDLLARPLQ